MELNALYLNAAHTLKKRNVETGNTNNTQSAQQKQNQQGFNFQVLISGAILPPGAWEAIKAFSLALLLPPGSTFLIKPLQEKDRSPK